MYLVLNVLLAFGLNIRSCVLTKGQIETTTPQLRFLWFDCLEIMFDRYHLANTSVVLQNRIRTYRHYVVEVSTYHCELLRF